MAYRSTSPGSRKIANPARASDGVAELHRHDRHNSYAAPRTGGVIPISTETFVNMPIRNVDPRYSAYSGGLHSYTGKPRRTSTVESQRGFASVSAAPSTRSRASLMQDDFSSIQAAPSSRSRATVAQDDYARPVSPSKATRNRESYVSSATTKEVSKGQHHKVYSVDDGKASLVSDVNFTPGNSRHHRLRDSDRLDPRGASKGVEKERGRRDYPTATSSKGKEKVIIDDDAYSYTDFTSVGRDTEPRLREREVRPRRGSVDRGGASRERPVMTELAVQDPRKSAKEIGPPPSTRGWDKLNEGLARARSTRDRTRDERRSPTGARVPQSPTRARIPQSPTRGRYTETGYRDDTRDAFYIAPRTSSVDSYQPVQHDRGADRYFEYDDDYPIEPRRRERRNSTTRAPDRSIERRGFGIRRDGSQDRYGRSSDESIGYPAKYRDSAYATVEPHRRDTAPAINYPGEQTLDQERRDRLVAEKLQQEMDESRRQREAREKEEARQRESKRREDESRARERERERDRSYEQDRGSRREHDHDRGTDRERDVEDEQPPKRRQDYDRHRYDDSRNDEYSRNHGPDRKDPGPRRSGEDVSKSTSTAAVAAGGLAAAGTALGVGKLAARHDGRDKERDQDHDRTRDRDLDRDRDRDHDRRHHDDSQSSSDQDHLTYRGGNRERRRDVDRQQERARDFDGSRTSPPSEEPRAEKARKQQSHSDEGSSYASHRNNQQHGGDTDRGLGFAFEEPSEPSRPTQHSANAHDTITASPDRVNGYDVERRDEYPAPPTFEHDAVDPDEDYRRRMEQVQRELGGGTEDRGSDYDPDRERRRLERERRRRERGHRDEDDSVVGRSSNITDSQAASSQMPGHYDTKSVVAGASTAPRPTLRHRRSILDEPMSSADARIIDNSRSAQGERERRVEIVEPPNEEDSKRVKGILKAPTEHFPDHPNSYREGVAPLKTVRITSTSTSQRIR